MRRKRRQRQRQKQRQKQIVIAVVIILAAVAATFTGVYLKLKSEVNAVAADVIWGNIYIEDMDVAGRTSADVTSVLEETIAAYQNEKVILRVDDEEVEVTLGDFGLKAKNLDTLVEEAVSYGKEGSVWERYQAMKNLEEKSMSLDILCEVDEDMVRTVIADMTKDLGTAPKDATISRENGTFVVTEEVAGVQVDVDASVEMIMDYFDEAWEYSGEETFELVTAVQEATVTSEALSQVKDVLGTFTTEFTSGNARAKNIEIATERINGTVLMPGEEMSASDAMGSRTAENGYLAAGSYLAGEVVDSIGGGVCQVSTTLYNAILDAELEVTERWAHSMTVSYVPVSKDAAIAEGYKDLKFKNNADTPIYVEGYTKGGSVTFTIYGLEARDGDREVKYVSETIGETEMSSKFVEDSSAPFGITKKSSGHAGKKAELWKIVYENGEEVSREKVNTSTYSMSPNVYSVGTASTNKEASELVKNAISSQDRSAIEAAIQKAKAMIAATAAE